MAGGVYIRGFADLLFRNQCKHLIIQNNKICVLCRTVFRRYLGTHTDVELTSVRYPETKRGPYAKITDNDLAFFNKALDGRLITDSSELHGHNTDWLKICRGNSNILLRPKSTAEVSEILGYCNQRDLAVVPQGGNTGLVGGSVPVFDEVILSTQLMNQVYSVDAVSGALVCQAGCILGVLDEHVADHGLTMPLDLGAKGSCHIGGNVATNAGGIRLLRYGTLHGNVLGLEVVLANGQILDGLSTLRKDNTGYDLKQLFIGSEGTLGVITAVSILCPQRPNAVNVAFLGCDSFPTILKILKETRQRLGEILSAFEFLDTDTINVGRENLNMSLPIGEHPFYVLIETSGSHGGHDEEKLNNLLEYLMSSELVGDGTVASDLSKIKAIWGLRERVSEALMHDGYCYKYDVSLPHSKFYDLVEDIRKRVGRAATRVVGYGHVGDGNLHLNITAPVYTDETNCLIEPYIYDQVAKYRGSISAEHGLGFKKAKYIYHSKSKTAVNMMRQFKNLLDPKAILNPYKFLPKA